MLLEAVVVDYRDVLRRLCARCPAAESLLQQALSDEVGFINSPFPDFKGKVRLPKF